MNRVKRISVGLGVPLVVGAILTGGNVSAAATPVSLARVSMALTGLTSYQVDYTAQSTQKPPSFQKDIYVVVRHGGLRIDWLTSMHPSGAGDNTVIEEVISGSRACERYPVTAPFSCAVSRSLAASITAAVDPARTFSGKGVSVQFHSTVAKKVAGVTCAGYAFVLHTPTEHGSGVLYLAPKSNLPCEEDARVVGPAIGPAAAGATEKLITTWTWHRFNDPKLNIPAVPAS
ncbi:MAG TPA: hypothetical protein VN837_18400 [Chloroflexota bacterium]|nr:hypothetical protein [Chloroflexota bacterium]